jgi:hypothetical protein
VPGRAMLQLYHTHDYRRCPHHCVLWDGRQHVEAVGSLAYDTADCWDIQYGLGWRDGPRRSVDRLLGEARVCLVDWLDVVSRVSGMLVAASGVVTGIAVQLPSLYTIQTPFM